MSVTKVVAAPLRYYVLAPKPRWNIPLLTQTFGWGIIPSVLTITHDALPEDVEDDEEHYRLQKVAVGAVADVHGEPCRLMGAKTQEMWRLESDDGPLEAHPFDVVLGERTSSAFLSHRGLNTVTGRSALEWVYPTPAESCEVIAASPRSRMGVAVDPNLSVRDCYTIGYEALQADTDWEAYPWASLMRQAHLEGHVHIAAVTVASAKGEEHIPLFVPEAAARMYGRSLLAEGQEDPTKGVLLLIFGTLAFLLGRDFVNTQRDEASTIKMGSF